MPARSNRGRRGVAPKRKLAEIVPEEPPAKVFKSPWERDVDNILKECETAGKRGFPFQGPESNLRMMTLCAAPALAEAREDRHNNQTVMVGLMDQGLQNIEGRMVDDLKNCQERLAAADTVLAELEKLRDTSVATLEAKDQLLADTRAKKNDKVEIWAAAKKVTDECKRELKIREKALTTEQDVLDGLVSAYDAEFKKLTVAPVPEPEPVAPAEAVAPEAEIEKKVEELEIVEEAPKPAKRESAKGSRRRSVPKEPTTEDRIERILVQMRLHGADESLMNALPFALKSALDNPKPFDLEAMNACTKFFAEKRMWAEGLVFIARSSVEEQKAKNIAAETTQEAANQEQIALKASVASFLEEQKAANKDLKQKNQDINDHKAKDADTRTRVTNFDLWLGEMRMAIQMFGMLRDRTHPPPAAPIVEEPIVEEAAPIMEEAAPMEIDAPIPMETEA